MADGTDSLAGVADVSASVTDTLLLLALAAGVGCLSLGYLSYRRWGEPGSMAFGVFLGLWGLVPIAGTLGGTMSDTLSAIAQIGLWCLATLCWFLFALQYTGTLTRIRARLVGVLAAPSLVVVPWLWGPFANGQSPLLEVVGTLALTYYSGLVVIGAVLVLRVTRNYGHLTVRHGTLLVITGVVPSVTNIAFGMLVSDTGLTPLSAALFAAGFLTVFVAASTLLFRFGMFETTLAAGTIGERAIARESDDLLCIVDEDEHVLKLNEAAVERFDVSRRDALGEPLEGVAGHDIDTLRAEDTVTQRTASGVRTLDSQVTALRDQHGNRLGWMATLRDVTDREIRRQRLEVLNRLVRHDLRNQVSVIQAHAEAVSDSVESEELQDHLATVNQSADSLATLGKKAKTVEEVLGTDRETTFRLDEFVDDVVADCEDRWPEATFRAVDAPEDAVETDRRVAAFVLETLVEELFNGADAAEATVEFALTPVGTGGQHLLRIDVWSNSAALSEQDVDVVEAGSETPQKHGTGVGLWVTNWAVTDLGGELSFLDTGPHETQVRVELPARQPSLAGQTETVADS